MPLVSIIAIAIAVAAGLSLGCVGLRQNFRLAWHFGFFQAIMPIIGWTAGLTIRGHIERYDHWAAFALLLFIAQGMIRSGAKKEDDSCAATKDPTKGLTMVILSVATSMDALAVGLSLSMISISIWVPAVIIGLVAAVFTTLGLHLGATVSKATALRRYADLLGALVLIAIGFNILFEHGIFQ